VQQELERLREELQRRQSSYMRREDILRLKIATLEEELARLKPGGLSSHQIRHEYDAANDLQ
jgi:hypothetical protein